MDVFNLFREHEWDAENDRDGFRHLRTAIGDRLGARMLGASLYKLPPGERTWPYHYEEGCEEWLIVVSGRPNLRSPEGERQLNVGDVAVFPEGPEGAHQVINRSDQPAACSSSRQERRSQLSITPTAAKSGSGLARRVARSCSATSLNSTTGRANGRCPMQGLPCVAPVPGSQAFPPRRTRLRTLDRPVCCG